MSRLVYATVLLLVMPIALMTFTNFQSSHVTGLSQGSSSTTIDCSKKDQGCEKVRIDQYATSCEEWNPGESMEKLNCNYSSKNLDSVSLITDSANYVTAPMTDQNYRVEYVAPTGQEPWDLEFLPSGNPIWTKKDGNIKYYDGKLKTITTPKVESRREVGLLGLALHPNFTENRYVYIYYTEKETTWAQLRDGGQKINRVSRFEFTEEGLTNETVLVKVPGEKYHSGGRLEIGPDDKLYVSTGDADRVGKAAKNSFLGGKILRLNLDGSVPEDNPFEGSYVFSRGHRNPQGLAWNPETGVLYNTEHGGWREDEINRVTKGGNYGWGGYICDRKTGMFGDKSLYKGNWEKEFNNTPPIVCFENWTIAPSGATFINKTGHPWHGDLFVAGLRGKQVLRLNFEDGKPQNKEVFYIAKDNPKITTRIRDVEHHNNSLYVLGDGRGIVKLTPK